MRNMTSLGRLSIKRDTTDIERLITDEKISLLRLPLKVASIQIDCGILEKKLYHTIYERKTGYYP
jgi:hypothetical protein